MRRTAPLVVLATCGLAACGGGTTTKTVTVTKTVTAPAPAASTPQATTPPGGEDTATATPAPGSAGASPLPEGVVAADGTYKMRTRQSDFDGETGG